MMAGTVMKAKTVKLGGGRTIVVTRAEDIRYWRIYLLSSDGSKDAGEGTILDQSGPWDDSGAQMAFDEMMARFTPASQT